MKQNKSGSTIRTLAASLTTLLTLMAYGATAETSSVAAEQTKEHSAAQKYFAPIGTFDVIAGNGSGVAEIVDVTRNNKELVYTDGDNEQIGFVDIRRPRAPVGTVDVGGGTSPHPPHCC